MCSRETTNTKQLSEPEKLPTGPRSVNYRDFEKRASGPRLILE